MRIFRDILSKVQRRDIFLVLLFTIAALYFRSQNFANSIAFDSDFGRDSLFALRIMRGDLTLLGPQASVGGFYLAPLYFYGIAVVYLLFGLHPPMMVLTFILMGVFTVVVGYLVLRRHLSAFAGILFALLASTHPALVVASRTATNQPMMPLVTVLFFGVYLEAIKRQQYRWFFIAGLVFGLFFHVHFSALLLLPAVGLLLLYQTRGTFQRKIIAAVLFATGIIVMISPLIVFDISHHFITSKAFLQYLLDSAAGKGIAANHPHLSFIEKLDRIVSFTLQNKLLSIVLLGLLGIGMRIKRSSLFANVTIFTLSLSALGSIIMLLLYSGYLYDYYLLIPMTLFLLWTAAVASQVRPRFLIVVVILLLTLSQWRNLRFPEIFRTQENIQFVVDRIRADIDSTQPTSFTIFKDSSDRLTGIGYEYRFLLEKAGYQPVFEQSYEKAQVLYYIQEEGTKDPLVSTNWETTQFGATKKELLEKVQTNHGVVAVYRLTR
ncbi:glycosyltransferase family 39 protein [Candidatus Woesebacteria bacterium]|nr:glycosyltransferase family 39 protein [Candidatus Woesebacteria bacterium]